VRDFIKQTSESGGGCGLTIEAPALETSTLNSVETTTKPAGKSRRCPPRPGANSQVIIDNYRTHRPWRLVDDIERRPSATNAARIAVVDN
jgi:hypothetical protein